MRRGKRVTWVEYPYENPERVVYVPSIEPGIPVQIPERKEEPAVPERKEDERATLAIPKSHSV